MTISTTPLHDAETIRQQRNLTKSQKRTNTETREGVLVNNFIKDCPDCKVNLDDTCDTLVISNYSKMPSRLYEKDITPEKSILPISALSVGVMGTIALLAAFVKHNTKINLKIVDEKRLPPTTRNVAINEETHQALYQMIQSPTLKTIRAGVGVLTLTAMSFIGKTFLMGLKMFGLKNVKRIFKKICKKNLLILKLNLLPEKFRLPVICCLKKQMS